MTRKVISILMAIMMLIALVPMTAMADEAVIESIAGNSYVSEFGRMVRSFTIHFAPGTDLSGIGKDNIVVENNLTHPYIPDYSNGVERVVVHDNAMIIEFSPFLYKMGFVVSCVKNGNKLFSFDINNVTEMATEIADDFDLYKTDLLTYRLFTPESAEPLPLIVWFHGAGERGDSGDAPLTDYRASICWAEPLYQEKNPCSVLIPQIPTDKIWTDEDVIADVRAEIDKLIESGVADAKRIYVVGFSAYQGALWFTTKNLDIVAACLHMLYWHAYDPDPKTGDDWSGIGWEDIAKAQLPLWSVGAIDDPTKGTDEMLTYHIPYQVENNPNFHYSTWTTQEMYQYRLFGFLMHHGWIPAINNQEIIDWLFAQSK